MLDWWEGRGRGDPLEIALYRSSDSDEDEEDKVEDEDGIGEPKGEITSSPKRLLRLGGGRGIIAANLRPFSIISKGYRNRG